MSVAIEAAELMEHFQWIESQKAEEHARGRKEEIADEIADVAIYLFDLASVLDVDLTKAIQEKLQKNAERYPVSPGVRIP